MQVFAVHYAYDPAVAGHRAEWLERHRDWLRGIEQEGRLAAAGVYPDGSGALLIFLNQDEEAMSAELARDPFAAAGLIEHVEVKAWNPSWGPLSDIVASGVPRAAGER